MLIALELIRISLRLVRRNHDFLIGQPIPATDRDRVRGLVLAYPGVTDVGELLVTYIGPDQVWVLARVNVADNLDGGQVTRVVRGIESDLASQSRLICRVDVVPYRQEQSPSE